MDLSEGATFREELVERVTNSLNTHNDPVKRAYTMGGVRCGVLAAVEEIAKTYPTLAGRLYQKFGMSGWR